MNCRALPCLVVFVGIFLMSGLHSQELSPEWKVSFSHAMAADADLDEGGELGFSQTNLRLGVEQPMGRGQSWGLGLESAWHNYNFAGSTPLAATEYWNKVTDFSLSASWRKPVGDGGMLFAAPSVTFARADGADWGESMEWGGIFSYGRRYSDSLTIGFGAGFYNGLEDTKFFPVLLVAWQINPQWRLGNSFRPGPAGPAGLELAFSPSESWEIALGAGWRSHRFRLDENGAIPNGIAEVEGFPVLIRLSWTLSDAVTIDLHGGLLLAGEVSLEDEVGHEIYGDDLGTAPIGAVSILAAF